MYGVSPSAPIDCSVMYVAILILIRYLDLLILISYLSLFVGKNVPMGISLNQLPTLRLAFGSSILIP